MAADTESLVGCDALLVVDIGWGALLVAAAAAAAADAAAIVATTLPINIQTFLRDT